MKKVISVLLILALALSIGAWQQRRHYVAQAFDEPIEIEDKTYCEATLEDDFEDDAVVIMVKGTVVLTSKI